MAEKMDPASQSSPEKSSGTSSKLESLSSNLKDTSDRAAPLNDVWTFCPCLAARDEAVRAMSRSKDF
ncbi:hypothetical protein N7447_004555 [Penicillium robsamsonii]|uniref:uncharacterized protein n=1 Tax=Penicillium robsamsonii TaxID=1792511 RepID=UPI002549A090|nr:uncharacterized protein N7447_004555 [Penicillium robsamsonii]KAJ5827792.1 hypothetical protein N7447_004555 [Penicillium robsamsonii]